MQVGIRLAYTLALNSTATGIRAKQTCEVHCCEKSSLRTCLTRNEVPLPMLCSVADQEAPLRRDLPGVAGVPSVLRKQSSRSLGRQPTGEFVL